MINNFENKRKFIKNFTQTKQFECFLEFSLCFHYSYCHRYLKSFIMSFNTFFF